MVYATTLTQKGQVTIPKQFREKLGFKPGLKIKFYYKQGDNQELILKSAKSFISLKGMFNTTKKYSKSKARKAYIKDITTGKV
jgi:AbrB family looped-hinge helix DNA binding protein